MAPTAAHSNAGPAAPTRDGAPHPWAQEPEAGLLCTHLAAGSLPRGPEPSAGAAFTWGEASSAQTLRSEPGAASPRPPHVHRIRALSPRGAGAQPPRLGPPQSRPRAEQPDACRKRQKPSPFRRAQTCLRPGWQLICWSHTSGSHERPSPQQRPSRTRLAAHRHMREPGRLVSVRTAFGGHLPKAIPTDSLPPRQRERCCQGGPGHSLGDTRSRGRGARPAKSSGVQRRVGPGWPLERLK